MLGPLSPTATLRPKPTESLRLSCFEQFARVGKALANPRRLELLDLLAQSGRTAESLAQETDMSVASTSRHLQTLRGAQLVEVRRRSSTGWPTPKTGRWLSK